MLRALQTWPYQGQPENAIAWLFRVARNAAFDKLRHERLIGGRAAEILRSIHNDFDDSSFEKQLRDDELSMIFMCCHPGISRDSSVALSLKAVGGFNVREIARAFLVDERTIAQRLVRAKRKIASREITLEMPSGEELKRRLHTVMEVIYLIFNEGYSAHEGDDLIRRDLCGEALRLCKLVVSSDFATPCVHALLALMALQAARSNARLDGAGDLILLEDQDHSRWDHELIAFGFHHFDLAIAGTENSEYHLQAAIAVTHARANSTHAIEWDTILRLYDQLLALNASPVIALNRAVALSRVHGPEAALLAIEPLTHDPQLQTYYLLVATRGHLLLALGRAAEAAVCIRTALGCTCSEPERRFLRATLLECETSGT